MAAGVKVLRIVKSLKSVLKKIKKFSRKKMKDTNRPGLVTFLPRVPMRREDAALRTKRSQPFRSS
jgi:hypothetical protein